MIPFPQKSSAITIDPMQARNLIDAAESFDYTILTDTLAELEEMCRDFDKQVDEIGETYSAMLTEAQDATKAKNPFKMEDQEDWFNQFKHTMGGGNFVSLILSIARGIQAGFYELRDSVRNLRPASLFKPNNLIAGRSLSREDLVDFALLIQMNQEPLGRFVHGVETAERTPNLVIHIAQRIVQHLENYHQQLRHRHTVEGIKVYLDDPIRTDLAISIYENADAHGEIQDGKKPDEISAYTVRKATILADALCGGLFGGWVKDPAKVIDFLSSNLEQMWTVAEALEKLIRETAQNVRQIIGGRAPRRLMTSAEFKDALNSIKELDPRNITAKDKVGLLSSEERLEADFRAETLENICQMLSSSTGEEIVQYVLTRKADWYKLQRDENSFYICKIGTGNPFLGDAPGGLEILPGVKPKVSLDDLVGSGFDEVREMISATKDLPNYTDLFLATSPSGKVDKNNVLLVGPMGCHRKGQKVLMFDGTLVPVEQIRVGDQLMGPDSTPRRVLELVRGIDEMVEVAPTKGDPWVVNKGHILTLVRQGRKKHSGEIRDVSVAEYMRWSAHMKREFQLFRVPVEFAAGKDLPIDPYFLGALLGDGSIIACPALTTIDEELVQEVYAQASGYGLHVTPSADPTSPVTRYWLSGDTTRKNSNPIMSALRDLGLGGLSVSTKFIPHTYKTASRENRLALLAGLVDTDGSLSNNCYDIQLKSKALAYDFAYIARSLGLAAYIRPTQRIINDDGKIGSYWRVKVSGDTNEIPSRLPHKKAAERKQIKSVLRTGFTLRELPVEAYYGFRLDGDQRYLLEDFTVTHNCGKSEALRAISSDRGSIAIFAQGSDFLTCWKGESEKNPKRLFEGALKLHKESERQVFISIDEIDTVLNSGRGLEAFGGTNLTTEFQILMDGVVSYPGLAVWGATNHPERMSMPIIRRFAKVLLVGELSKADRVKLLKKSLSYLPKSQGFSDNIWTDAADLLDGSVGDTVRKTADDVWRDKMRLFIKNKPEKAKEVVAFLQEDGIKFDRTKFSDERRGKLNQMLRSNGVEVNGSDIMRAVTQKLANTAIKAEIRTAVEIYKAAREQLIGLAV